MQKGLMSGFFENT